MYFFTKICKLISEICNEVIDKIGIQIKEVKAIGDMNNNAVNVTNRYIQIIIKQAKQNKTK